MLLGGQAMLYAHPVVIKDWLRVDADSTVIKTLMLLLIRNCFVLFFWTTL